MAISMEESTSKRDRLFILSLLFIPCLFIRFEFDSDTFWLIKSGRFVLKHGIPHIEPFTLHTGLHFVMQQWLTATLFAIIYDNLGSVFLYALVAVMKGLIIYSVFRLCMRVSEENFLVSFTIAFAISIPLDFFMVLRPSLFSLFIFTLELNLIESWISKSHPYNNRYPTSEYDGKYLFDYAKSCFANLKKNHLIWSFPILSVMLINLHAAMWPFFFILLAPYIIDSFHFNFRMLKGEGYPLTPIVIAVILSFAVGWINPYGFESMAYLYHSYGNIYISAMINEMQSPNFKTPLGIVFFIIYFIPILFYCFHKGETRLRHALVIIGTGYMGLASARSLGLFLVCGLPFLAHSLKFVQILKNPDTPLRYPWLRYLLLAFIILFIGTSFFIRVKNSVKETEISQPKKAVDYIITHLDKDKIRLYNSVNTGGYAEFKGLRTFIDTRAEAFCKSNNRKEDIIDDYFDVAFGKTYYRELIDKYKLTHFLVEKNDLFYVYLPKDPDFDLLFSDGNYKVFALKTAYRHD